MKIFERLKINAICRNFDCSKYKYQDENLPLQCPLSQYSPARQSAFFVHSNVGKCGLWEYNKHIGLNNIKISLDTYKLIPLFILTALSKNLQSINRKHLPLHTPPKHPWVRSVPPRVASPQSSSFLHAELWLYIYLS